MYISQKQKKLPVKAHLQKQNVSLPSPGTDGLRAEFSVHVWAIVQTFLLLRLTFVYHIGKLLITQRRRVIKLIPKKETDLKNLKTETGNL